MIINNLAGKESKMNSSVLVTGSNQGIGLALAKVFSQHDWDVVACCRKPEEALTLQSIQAASAGRLQIKKLDVTKEEEIAELADDLVAMDIDILLNNAGILGPEKQGFGSLEEEFWLETFRVNTIGPYKMACAFLDNVARSQRKIIATITSEMGSVSNNVSGDYYVYRTSKAAANMVMKNMSYDLRNKRITCIALHPGWVRTRMGGSSAPLSPEESAAGLFRTLSSLGEDQNGAFLDYAGRIISW